MAKFNLNGLIYDSEGSTIPDKNLKIFTLVKPKEVEVYNENGKVKKIKAVAVFEEKPKLTYSRAARLALKGAGNEEDNEFDKIECADLLFKLVADTDVELSVSERNLIIEASKKYSDVEVFYRIRQLLDTEPEDKEEKKTKK